MKAVTAVTGVTGRHGVEGEYDLQRHKKSELSGWQLSTRKNFPDEVRKLFLRKKHVNRVCNKKSVHKFFL